MWGSPYQLERSIKRISVCISRNTARAYCELVDHMTWMRGVREKIRSVIIPEKQAP